MPLDGESPLLLIHLPAAPAADEVRRAWDRDAAVCVVDPALPAARLASTVAALRPGAVVDASGTSHLGDGRRLPEGTAAVVATSGTTGTARYVVHSRAALEASARGVCGALGLQAGADRWLACLPLYYVAGLAIVARSYFCGSPLTVLSGFDVDAVAGAAGRGTVVSLVPTMLVRLLEAGVPLSGFRHLLLGGGPVPDHLVQRSGAAGCRPTTTYGLTETGGGCVHDGHALDGVDVSLAEDGEVLVAGGVLMQGYLDDPDATRSAFTGDGRLRTGDLGRFDDRGRLVVTDRKKDLVITGGVNVSPSVVEGVLARHPAVAEVCVAGLPDEEWGERVVAFVVAHDAGSPPSVDELRAFGAADLTGPELPREVRAVESIPRSAGGKVLRRQLRSAATAG